MEPDLSVIDPTWDVLPETARPVHEGVWFANRKDTMFPTVDIRHGLWWTHSGSHAVSLAEGTGLHGNGAHDWENWVFRGPSAGGDVCCHDSFEAAQACALEFIRSGHWCTTWDESDG